MPRAAVAGTARDHGPRGRSRRLKARSKLSTRASLPGLRHLDDVRGAESKFLIATSGGVDSSVVCCLLERAFGPERVFAVNMPTRFNAAVTQDNARSLCAALGVDYLCCPIESLYEAVAALVQGAEFSVGRGEYTRLVDENVQARIRFADVLSGLAAKYGLVFTSNGNKTEVALGYATLYGDVSGAVAPIADLYKVQVFALARFLNKDVYGRVVVPENLLDGSVVPSAELSEAQDVTQGLGDPIKYGYHDAVLRAVHRIPAAQQRFVAVVYRRRAAREVGVGRRGAISGVLSGCAQLDRRPRMGGAPGADHYFKRIQAPPIIVLSKRAFGFDLRETQQPPYAPRRCEQLKAEA